jgi:histidine triad (HIT) family protein
MDGCIFCKIVKNEIPSTKVYQDEQFIAFLDIEPVADGHLLIIPTHHVVWMHEADDETVAGIFKLAKKLMLAVKKGTQCDYVQISVSGTDVPHFHVHLIPRYLEDGFSKYPTKEFDPEQAQDLVNKITQEL